MSDAPTVALGVTGGIAAYKACDLVRRLRDAGHEVRVVMTRNAQQFVTPLLFETLSGWPVITDQFQAPEEYGGINHIGLARRAALLLVAPATANVIGKMAGGIADDFLTTMAIATAAPIMMAPAMNTVMWGAAVVRDNVRRLAARGVTFVAPDSGSLACGEVGEGRMADVATIVGAVAKRLERRVSMAGTTVLVNGGPTREHLDAVRFLSNPSSGRMGIELAAAARDRGAAVTLVLGPTEIEAPHGVRAVRVTSAEEMLAATLEAARGVDIAVLSAAVSDFAPATVVAGKVKKSAAAAAIELRPTPDVLSTLARTARPPVLVGFAAEHGDPLAEAGRKCLAKGCDFVVGNDIAAAGLGFGSEDNAAVLVFDDGRSEPFGPATKRELAERVWDRALQVLAARRRPAVARPETGDLA